MVQNESTRQVSHVPTWSFFVIAALGLWLFTAPAAFDFHSSKLVISDMVCGALLVFLSMCCRKNPKQLMLWLIALIGIWIQFSPLLYWAPNPGSYYINVLIGCLVITFSVILFPLPGELPDAEPTVPPGWKYNPSSGPQRLPIAILVFFCWTISRYLAAYQLGYIETIWDPFFVPGTVAVIESTVSKDFFVSDAGLGALAYTVEFFTTCQGGKARWRTAPWLVLVFGILVVPVGLVSMTLVILQPLVVGTWCTLCLATASCMLIAIPFAIDEVAASLQFLKLTGWKNLFRGGECPGAMVDERTPEMNHSMLEIVKAGAWGVTLPWNLVLLVVVGIFLMATPAIFHIEGLLFDTDPILGAFTVVASVVSFSERMRKFRWAVLFFGLAVLALAWIVSQGVLVHSVIGILMVLLCIRKGELD